MKKTTLLLALLLISTFGYSQIGGNDPINGIDIIIKKDPGSRPMINTGNDPIIEEVNKLELEYLNLKAKEVQYGFANQDLSKLKTKDEVFKAYIEFLQIEIKELHIKITVDQKKLAKKDTTIEKKRAATEIKIQTGLEHKAGITKGGSKLQVEKKKK